MPIFSLNSNYGIGTFGKDAFDFVDFLKESGQSIWQILPLNPTSFGDSPYQSPSAFALNPYFIDLDLLIEDGLLTIEDVANINHGEKGRVDYGLIYSQRYPLLKKASKLGIIRDADILEDFIKSNKYWLPDYALFMAIKRHFNMVSFSNWPKDIATRQSKALKYYKELLKEDIEIECYIQYLCFKQWQRLKEYANNNGIKIMGDIALYVSSDSSDLWANPKNFLVNKNNKPTLVAGVPPDAFSDEGQLWGNPIYNYKYMEEDNWRWWKRRIGNLSKCFDAIRIDHFRGLESYWALKANAKNAINGKWYKGPGIKLIDQLKKKFPNIEFVAEDLGIITPQVNKLLEESGLPGMKVLQFCFDYYNDGSNLPHNFKENSICYSGTHDNHTLIGWLQKGNPLDIAKAKRYLGLNEQEGFNNGMIRCALSCKSNVTIIPLSDWLGLGDEARINTPATSNGNWLWRIKDGQLTHQLAKHINDTCRLYGR